MAVLRFMDARPKLDDGSRSSHVRCDCLTQANLQVVIKDGEIVFAGCPICKKESVIEILPDGEIGFFPPGVVVL
jgi:hypothetical protein